MQDDDEVPYECEPSQLGGSSGMCKTGQCIALSQCGKKDFENDTPPTACGYTDSGEDMVCCTGRLLSLFMVRVIILTCDTLNVSVVYTGLHLRFRKFVTLSVLIKI